MKSNTLRSLSYLLLSAVTLITASTVSAGSATTGGNLRGRRDGERNLMTLGGYGNFTIELAYPEDEGFNNDENYLHPPQFLCQWASSTNQLAVTTGLEPHPYRIGSRWYVTPHPTLEETYYIRINEPRVDTRYYGGRNFDDGSQGIYDVDRVIGVDRHFYLSIDETNQIVISEKPFPWQFVDIESNGGTTFGLRTAQDEERYLTVSRLLYRYGDGAELSATTLSNSNYEDAVLLQMLDHGETILKAPGNPFGLPTPSPTNAPTVTPTPAPTVTPDALEDSSYYALVENSKTGRFISSPNEYSAGTSSSGGSVIGHQHEWKFIRLFNGNYRISNRATNSIMGCNQHDQIFAYPPNLANADSSPLRFQWQLVSVNNNNSYQMICAQKYQNSNKALSDGGYLAGDYLDYSVLQSQDSTSKRQHWNIRTIVV